MNAEAIDAGSEPYWCVAGLDFRNLIWVLIALGIMIGVILYDEAWPLRFVHVASGVLLTGFDILMGFVIGPVVRRLDFDGRRAFSLNLLPKTLFILTAESSSPADSENKRSGRVEAVRVAVAGAGSP